MQRRSASPSGRTSGLPHARAAWGTTTGGAVGAQRQHRADHFGDDVAGLAHDERVAARTSLTRTWSSLCSVATPTVEPPTNTGSSTANGVARRCARSTPGCRAAGWCAPPAGTCRRSPSAAPRVKPSRAALLDVVDLDDDAVDLVGEIVAVLLPVLAVSEHVVERGERLRLRVDREAERAQVRQRLGVARQRRTALDGAELVGPEARSRWAVIEASFWRRLPAAELRG